MFFVFRDSMFYLYGHSMYVSHRAILWLRYIYRFANVRTNISVSAHILFRTKDHLMSFIFSKFKTISISSKFYFLYVYFVVDHQTDFQVFSSSHCCNSFLMFLFFPPLTFKFKICSFYLFLMSCSSKGTSG